MTKPAFIFLLFIVSLFSCKQRHPDINDTRLDEMIIGFDSTLIQNQDSLFSIQNFNCQIDKPFYSDFDNKELKSFFHFTHIDTTLKKRSFFVGQYNNKKYFLIAFRDAINFWACCIPDNEIVLTKNFKELDHFKNGDATFINVNQYLIFSFNSFDSIKNGLSKFIDKRNYMKFEVLNGRTIWSIKKH